MSEVVDAKEAFFNRRMPPEMIDGLTASIVRNAEYLARCILSRGDVTISRDVDNKANPFKLLLKHLDERS